MDVLEYHWMEGSMFLDYSSFQSTKIPRHLCAYHTIPRYTHKTILLATSCLALNTVRIEVGIGVNIKEKYICE